MPRSRRQPPCYPLSKGIGGGSAAVIHGSDRDVPLWSTSLESPKATRCSARSKGYQFRANSFPQLTHGQGLTTRLAGFDRFPDLQSLQAAYIECDMQNTRQVELTTYAKGDKHEEDLNYRSRQGLWTRGRYATCGEGIRCNRHSRDLGPGPDLETPGGRARCPPL